MRAAERNKAQLPSTHQLNLELCKRNQDPLTSTESFSAQTRARHCLFLFRVRSPVLVHSSVFCRVTYYIPRCSSSPVHEMFGCVAPEASQLVGYPAAQLLARIHAIDRCGISARNIVAFASFLLVLTMCFRVQSKQSQVHRRKACDACHHGRSESASALRSQSSILLDELPARPRKCTQTSSGSFNIYQS